MHCDHGNDDFASSFFRWVGEGVTSNWQYIDDLRISIIGIVLWHLWFQTPTRERVVEIGRREASSYIFVLMCCLVCSWPKKRSMHVNCYITWNVLTHYLIKWDRCMAHHFLLLDCLFCVQVMNLFIQDALNLHFHWESRKGEEAKVMGKHSK